MAYFLFCKNKTNSTDLHAIYENSNDRQYYQDRDVYEEVEVNNEDFLKIKRASHILTGRNGSSFTWHSVKINLEGNDHFNDIHYVEDEKEWVSSELDRWIKANPNHAKTPDIQTYKNSVDAFDPLTVSYPTSLTWGEIMENNSIPYFCVQELPRY